MSRKAPGAGARAPGAGPGLSATDWSRYLGEKLPGTVRVVYGRSRSNPLQARRTAARRHLPPERPDVEWDIRLHAMFATAPADVREAVAAFLASGRRARRSREVLQSWIDESLASLPPRQVAESALRETGSHHDLRSIAVEILGTELREDFGAGRPVPRLTWGRTSSRRTRRGLRLGSYDPELHLVRVHPALDQPAVPHWFVRYVLFHELLHAVHPPVRGPDGRWVRHGPRFAERERAYPELAKALAWERAHIDRLIRSARTRKPLRPSRGGRRVPEAAVRFLQGLLFPDSP